MALVSFRAYCFTFGVVIVAAHLPSCCRSARVLLSSPVGVEHHTETQTSGARILVRRLTPTRRL